MKFLLACLASVAVASALNLPDAREKLGDGEQVFAAYVVNWAHYIGSRGKYAYTADDLKPIASRLDVALYSFIYFCPPAGSTMPYWGKAPIAERLNGMPCDDSSEFELVSVDPMDKKYIPTIVAMDVKVVLSIGGWNFPSAYFSAMAASSDARGKFVASVTKWMGQYGASGVDLDWEFPCSPERENSVKMSCTSFKKVMDIGGKCPDDSNNLLLLVKDLRAGLPEGAVITIASQAGNAHADNMNLVAVTEYIDLWHVMSYDYAVSDVPGDSVTSPNSPLYMPKSAPNAVQMSVNDSVVHYINAGVPANKIMIGLPLYAHTWYTPGLTGDDWKKFGNAGQEQGQCCGPFAATMGAKPGQGCSLCGSMMYSEILAAQPEICYDTETQSTIAYATAAGADGGYTAAGTWMTYNDIQSAKAFVEYQQNQGFAGMFVYSTDMDTLEDGKFTYRYMNAMADAMGKAPSEYSLRLTDAPSPAPPCNSNAPTPAPGPAPCPGGSLLACMQACPTAPPSAFTDCVTKCATLCP